MNRPGPRPWRQWMVVAAAALGMSWLYGQIEYTRWPFSHMDLANYRTIAQAAPGIATTLARPFAYRLLGPYLVGLLPLPDPQAFCLASVVLSVALALLCYAYLRRMGLAGTTATVLAVLLTFNRYFFGLTVWDCFQINDLVSLILMLGLMWAMLDRRWAAFAALFLLGALARETTLLMAPVAAACLLERRARGGEWLRVAAAAAPGLAASVLIRRWVPTTGGHSLLAGFAIHWSKILSPALAIRLLVVPLVPVSLVPLVCLGTTRRFFRERRHALVLVALVLASTLAASDSERLMAPVLCVAYPLVGMALEELRAGRGLFGVLLGCGFLASLHHQVARYPVPGRGWSVACAMASLAVATAAVAVARWRAARPAVPGTGPGTGSR